MFSFKKNVAPICVTAAVFGVLALAGCGSGDGLTGGVAATVNGTDVPEDKVTTYIQKTREAQQITNDRDWANWLNNNGYTPETLREAVINMYVTQELEKQAASEKGIEVTDAEVDTIVESMRSNYDTDEAWQDALVSAGYDDEEAYRENVYLPMLEEKLLSESIDEADTKADDETVLSYITMYASTFDGMKRSSHILFAADDEATAQEVLDQLKAGADFAEMAKQYSGDSSGANGGDVGWNKVTAFVSSYETALEGLEKGEISDLVTSEYGIHIIKCTDVWNAPEKIESLDQVPEQAVNAIRTQVADPAALQMAYSNYLQSLRDAADIHVNNMPAAVPYNVDMARYVSSSAAAVSVAPATSDAAQADSSSATEESSSASESESSAASGSSSSSSGK